MNLGNLKTGRRLILGFGILAALMVVLAATAMWEMGGIKQGMDTALVESAKLSRIKDVGTSLDNIYLDLYNYFPYMHYLFITKSTEKQVDAFFEQYPELADKFDVVANVADLAKVLETRLFPFSYIVDS